MWHYTEREVFRGCVLFTLVAWNTRRLLFTRVHLRWTKGGAWWLGEGWDDRGRHTLWQIKMAGARIEMSFLISITKHSGTDLEVLQQPIGELDGIVLVSVCITEHNQAISYCKCFIATDRIRMNYIRNIHVLIDNITEAFQICMTLIILWNIKEDILKYGVIFEHIMKVSGVKCFFFRSQCCSKYLLLCSEDERKPCRLKQHDVEWIHFSGIFPITYFNTDFLQLAIKNINITILEPQVWGKNWPKSQNNHFCLKNPLNIHCLIISCLTLMDFYYSTKCMWLLLGKCFTFGYCI